MNRTLAMVVLASGLAASPVLADTFVIDPAHSDASFQVRHFVSNVRGRFTDFTGTIVGDPAKPETASVEFTIKAASIDTAQPGRDKHLRSADFFDAEKFPEITFKSTKVTPTGKESVSKVDPQLRGGLFVSDVAFASPAAKAGVQKGDLIIGFHLWEALNLDNVLFVLNHKDLTSFNPVKTYFVRDGKVREAMLPIGD